MLPQAGWFTALLGKRTMNNQNYQLTLFVFCIFQCLVLKNQGGEMVVAIQSKGENWFWNWGTLLQVRASVLNMYKQLPRM